MISPEYPLASWFLIIASAFFGSAVALPLLFAPLTWARWFRWKMPDGNSDLTVYFGRCLGATALVLIIAVCKGIPDPRNHRFVFDLISIVCGLMIVIHVWGWIRKTQPLSETVEIAVWALTMAMSLGIRFMTLT